MGKSGGEWQNVHCATQGANLIINEVKPGGLLSCLLPGQFGLFFKTPDLFLDNIWYDVHLDYPPIGIINTDDTVVYTSGLISLSANGNYISPVTDYCRTVTEYLRPTSHLSLN
ncbi:MAG: hypothetical protein IPL84_03475 [Chitinophagaceae bacterium]|nr:hypothetical protein [Chitinophagaceae bacterium]